MLDIISITKDDLNGISKTIKSTRNLRQNEHVNQIVIDSSNELTAKVVRALTQDEGMDYYWVEPGGISRAFNKGVIEAKKDWLWFLNGGDQVHPTLDVQLFFGILEKSTADSVVFQLEMEQSKRILGHMPLWERWPLLCNWMYHPSTVVRRRLFTEFGLFSEEYKIAMDNDLWLRFFSNNITADVLSIPIALFDETGISSTQCAKASYEMEKVFKRYFRMIIRKWINNGVSVYKIMRSWRKDYK